MDIEIQNVTKKYGEQIVLENYSLRIPQGGITTIMGKSGSGKTTLLRLIAGLEKADAGVVRNVPERMSMVFQEDRLCEELSASANVRLVLPKSTAEQELVDHFKQVGIEQEIISKPVSEYSGGMKRRVAVVRALMAQSDILLLDEPCNALDEKTKQMVIQYVLGYRRGRTMIVVTHDIEEAEMYGGKIIRL